MAMGWSDQLVLAKIEHSVGRFSDLVTVYHEPPLEDGLVALPRSFLDSLGE